MVSSHVKGKENQDILGIYTRAGGTIQEAPLGSRVTCDPCSSAVLGLCMSTAISSFGHGWE
jgi:hypothetical protein